MSAATTSSVVMKSTRWCPTPEQLMILEEMFRSGHVRTPTASQIQQITAHLSYYGKIEAKNVFYWFQNHKARDRQKLRKKLAKLQHQHQQKSQHASSSTQQQHISNATKSFLTQGACQQDASTKVRNYTWKQMDIPSTSPMNGQDWRMMNVGPISCYQIQNHKPVLKTLELFPITTTNLKEDWKNTYYNKPKPCYTTSSNYNDQTPISAWFSL